MIRFHYSLRNFDLDFNTMLELDSVLDRSLEVSCKESEYFTFKTDLLGFCSKKALKLSIYDFHGNLISEDLSEVGLFTRC